MTTIDRPADRKVNQLRQMLYWGGGLFGVGIGIGVLWLIRVYEAGNPQPLNDNGIMTSLYPDAKLTAFIVLVGSAIAGLGLAMVFDATTSILHGRSGTAATADPGPPTGPAETPGHA